MTSAQQRAALQRQIWAIANEVRGAVDGWDFKQYVLGTLFYRFISENFASYIEAGDDSIQYASLADRVWSLLVAGPVLIHFMPLSRIIPLLVLLDFVAAFGNWLPARKAVVRSCRLVASLAPSRARASRKAAAHASAACKPKKA